jgi:hypothetical protein
MADLLFEFNFTLLALTASDGPRPYPIFLDCSTEAAERICCLFSTRNAKIKRQNKRQIKVILIQRLKKLKRIGICLRIDGV